MEHASCKNLKIFRADRNIVDFFYIFPNEIHPDFLFVFLLVCHRWNFLFDFTEFLSNDISFSLSCSLFIYHFRYFNRTTNSKTRISKRVSIDCLGMKLIIQESISRFLEFYFRLTDKANNEAIYEVISVN